MLVVEAVGVVAAVGVGQVGFSRGTVRRMGGHRLAYGTAVLTGIAFANFITPGFRGIREGTRNICFKGVVIRIVVRWWMLLIWKRLVNNNC